MNYISLLTSSNICRKSKYNNIKYLYNLMYICLCAPKLCSVRTPQPSIPKLHPYDQHLLRNALECLLKSSTGSSPSLFALPPLRPRESGVVYKAKAYALRTQVDIGYIGTAAGKKAIHYIYLFCPIYFDLH